MSDMDAFAILADQYIVEAPLGEGTYGIVVRAKSRQTGALYAIKMLRLDGLSEGVPATAVREITLLQDLAPHPNIVRLLQVICKNHRLFLVFELMNEDLRKFLNRATSVPRSVPQGQPWSAIPIAVVQDFARQILHALWFCHQNRVVHRDLKPGNILVEELKSAPSSSSSGQPSGTSPRYVCKLADFGLARTFELPLVTYTNEVVTLWYRAPEILLGETRYTPAVDIWSVGCIIGELLVGKPLFRGESQMDQLQRIFAVTGTPTEETWQGVHLLKGFPSQEALPRYKTRNVAQLFDFCGDAQAGNFVAALLTPNPKSRPTASDALAHPFLAS